MKNAFLAFIISSFVFVGSCHKRTEVKLIDEIGNAPKYSSIIDDWTKGARHYYWNDVRFFVKATYKSLPLRLAYLKEYAKKYKITAEEQRAMYEKEMSDHGNYNDFFVAVFSSAKDINNLRDDKKWRLYLTDGLTKNVRIEPLSIDKIKEDSLISHFYPHVTPWSSNYLVRFSKTATDAENELSSRGRFSTLDFLMASIAGEHTFQWKLDHGDLPR